MTEIEIIQEFNQTRDFKRWTNFYLQNPKLINELVDVIVRKEKYPIAEYSSWLLTHIVKAKKEILYDFEKQFIEIIFNENNNQTVLRNCVNVLQFIPISNYKESELIDRYINFIQNSNNKVALHVYSMSNLLNMVNKYPEIKTEIVSIIETYYTERSPAYKFAVRSFLKNTKKIN